MKILFVIGNSINENSSTNLFKFELIKSFSKDNVVTVLMCSNNFKYKSYTKEGIYYIEIPNNSIFEIIIHRIKKISFISSFFKKTFIFFLKKVNEIFIILFYPKYRYYSSWLNFIKLRFLQSHYDFVISISHPPASHKAVINLKENKLLIYKKWIQIWFEPWYLNPKKKAISKLVSVEEHLLYEHPDKILFGDPIFLSKQIKQHPKYKDKFDFIYLPSSNIFSNNPNSINNLSHSVGYFGNYYSFDRNIIPFYKSISTLENFKFNIIGNSDIKLSPKKNLYLSKRISNNDLEKFENNCDILIILGNLRDQIPAKIYYYSSSNKFLLFILDGNLEYKNKIKSIFGKFNRFIFCDNDIEDITQTIKDIFIGKYKQIKNSPITEFNINSIVKKILL